MTTFIFTYEWLLHIFAYFETKFGRYLLHIEMKL